MGSQNKIFEGIFVISGELLGLITFPFSSSPLEPLLNQETLLLCSVHAGASTQGADSFPQAFLLTEETNLGSL